MIKHIVMFKLKERRDDNIETLQQKLLSLKDKIDVLKELEVGVDFDQSERAMDIVLITTFENKEALEIYRTHPEHLPVVAYVREICSESRVVDYELE